MDKLKLKKKNDRIGEKIIAAIEYRVQRSVSGVRNSHKPYNERREHRRKSSTARLARWRFVLNGERDRCSGMGFIFSLFYDGRRSLVMTTGKAQPDCACRVEIPLSTRT